MQCAHYIVFCVSVHYFHLNTNMKKIIVSKGDLFK